MYVYDGSNSVQCTVEQRDDHLQLKSSKTMQKHPELEEEEEEERAEGWQQPAETPRNGPPRARGPVASSGPGSPHGTRKPRPVHTSLGYSPV